MDVFTEMPYGYRWMTDDEIDEYNTAENHKWGWMRDEYIGVVTTCLAPGGQPVRQWGCMIEFGLEHDHDPVECESMMSRMSGSVDYFYDHDYYDAYNREAEEMSLGRPLFPNEY